MRYLLVFVYLCLNLVKSSSQTQECQQLTVCASAFDYEDRTREIINCNIPFEAKLRFECKIVYNFHVTESRAYTGIQAQLKITDKHRKLSPVLNATVFQWDRSYANNNLSQSKIVEFTFDNATGDLTADLIIYNIALETSYKICPMLEMIGEERVCCEVEAQSHEEDLFALNFYMALVIVGLVALIYLIIVIIFWKFPPPTYKSVDEMLSHLPLKHVKALKQLVSKSETDQEDADFTDTIHGVAAGVDNPGFKSNEEMYDTYGTNESLYVEANKLRRMSRTSQFSAPANACISTINISANILDPQSLAVKILKEEKRRASLKPYKKTYALENSSDSEQED